MSIREAPRSPRPEPGSHEAALHTAGRLLGRRQRSAAELRSRLELEGFDQAVVEGAMARLVELGLADDAALARAWAEERAGGGRAPRLIVRELQERGVERAVAEAAVAAAGVEEAAQARRLAARWVTRVADLPLERQASRLQGTLARRGFDADVIEAAVRAVLPPEGWD
jgi:regulatory protein